MVDRLKTASWEMDEGTGGMEQLLMLCWVVTHAHTLLGATNCIGHYKPQNGARNILALCEVQAQDFGN